MELETILGMEIGVGKEDKGVGNSYGMLLWVGVIFFLNEANYFLSSQKPLPIIPPSHRQFSAAESKMFFESRAHRFRLFSMD